MDNTVVRVALVDRGPSRFNDRWWIVFKKRRNRHWYFYASYRRRRDALTGGTLGIVNGTTFAAHHGVPLEINPKDYR